MDLLKTALWFILPFFLVGKLNCTTSQRVFSYVQSNINGGLHCLDTENSKIETIELQENLPNITALTFQSCELLKTTVIHQLINNLELERLTRLEFNFKNNTEIELSYFRFNGFNLEEFVLEHVQYVQKIKNSNEVDVNEATFPIELLQSRDKLQVLRLSVGLSTLSENILFNLTNLKRLYLQNNELVIIPSDAVKNLENLEIVDFSHNKLKKITFNQFPNLKQLKYLNLSSNEIGFIYSNAFKDNTNLEVVDLQNNPILGLAHLLFAYFPKLLKVNLRNCTLRYAPQELFYQSKSLQSLNLSFNLITFIQNICFDSLIELRHLDLSSNNLDHWPDYTFENLKSLNISYNSLTSLGNIKKKAFSSLRGLDLSHNKFSSMLTDFRFSKNFSYINLSHNHLMELVLHSCSLQKIDASHNELTMIGKWIFQIKTLKHLDVSFNKITSLDIDLFVQFSSLSTLNLSNNRISSIEVFTLKLLEKHQRLDNFVIKLNKNPIKCDCLLTNFVKYFEGTLNPMIHKYLTIEADDLVCEYPENLKSQFVKELNPLTLTCPYDYFYAQNCPDFCDCYVRVWDYAIIVDCESKNLTDIPILKLPPSNILEVNLQNNFLISGPRDLMGYENVTTLLLSNNNIAHLTWIPPRLKTLTLDYNNFTVFDSNVIWELFKPSHLINVSLGGNPWVFNCSEKLLKKYLLKHKVSKLIDVESITCTKNKYKMIDLDYLCQFGYLDIITCICFLLIITGVIEV